MPVHTRLIACCLLITIAGCGLTQSGEQAPADMAEDTCNANRFTDLVGKTASDLDLTTLPELHRILGPNDMATMDYRAERLNILTDEAGVIVDLECG